MEDRETWIIVDLIKSAAIYGIEEKSMMFSSKKIAMEVAFMLFKKRDEFTVVRINI